MGSNSGPSRPTFSPESVTGALSPHGTTELGLLLCVVLLLMGAGLFGNITAILTICFSKRQKLQQHGFIVSLSLADTVFLSVGFPFIIQAIAKGGWVLGSAACYLQGYITAVCCHASIFNLALIAFNRYICIVHVSIHRTLFTRRNSVVMMVAVWTLAGLLPLPAFAGWGRFAFLPLFDACMYDWKVSRSFVLYINIIGFLCPGLFIPYCYARIFMTVWHSKRRVKPVPAAAAVVSTQPQPPRLKKEEVRLAAQLLLVFVLFVVCWTPFLLLTGFLDMDGELGDSGIYDLAANLVVLNSVVNPAVYFFFNRTLRQEARRLLTFGKWRSTAQTTRGSVVDTH